MNKAKKKSSAKLFVVLGGLLAVLLLVTILPLGAFAEDTSSQPLSVSGSQVPASGSEQAAASGDVASNTQPEPTQTPVVPALNPMNPGDLARYDGIVLGSSGITAEYGAAVFRASAGKTLEVSAVFDGSSTVTNREVRVVIGNGLKIGFAPGLSATTYGAVDLSTLGDIADYVEDVTFTRTTDKIYNNYLPFSGVLVYKIKHRVESVNIALHLIADIPFCFPAKNATTTLATPLTVTTQYKNNGEGDYVALDTAKLDSITLPYDAGVMYLVGTRGTPAIIEAGSSGTASASLYSTPANNLIESYTQKWTVPAGVHVTNVQSTSTSVLPQQNITWSETGGVLTIKIVHCLTTASLKITFSVDSTTVPGSYVFTSIGAGELFTYGATEGTGHMASEPLQVIVPEPFQNSISWRNYALNYAPTASDTIVPLGGFVSNRNLYTQDIGPQLTKLDFSDANLAVTDVILYSPNKSFGTITVVTTAGQTFTVENATSEVTTYNLKLSALGTIADGETIKTVTYTLSGLAKQQGVGMNESNVLLPFAHISFYGKVLNSPSSVKALISSVDATDSQGFSSPNVTTGSSTVSISTSLQIPIYFVNASTGAGTYQNKDVISMSANWSIRNNVAIGTVRSWKGWNIYLREIPGVPIDDATIRVTSGTQTYAGASLNIDRSTVDNKGFRIVKISLPNLHVGNSIFAGSAVGQSFTVKYDMKVGASALGSSYLVSDLMSALPQGTYTGLLDANMGSGVSAFGNNQFNVDGSNNLANWMLRPASNSGTVTVFGGASFNIRTATNLNGSAWVTYEGTPETIINLNPEGNVLYQVVFTNNTKDAVNSVNAMVPIPKKGGVINSLQMPQNPNDYDPKNHLQDKAFGWTASLGGEIVNANYDYMYSVDYETDIASSGWKTWAQLTAGGKTADDVKMVKIVPKTPVPAGAMWEISFPLIISDPDAAANAGKVDTYSAYVYRNLTGGAGYAISEPVAIRLVTGKISGVVYKDTNRNGTKDAGESGIPDVQVAAYEAGHAGDPAYLIGSKTTDGNGAYVFTGLDNAVATDVEILNTAPPVLNAASSAGKYAFSAPASADNHITGVHAGIIPSGTGADALQAGLIDPFTVSFDSDGGSAVAAVKRFGFELIQEPTDPTKDGFTFLGWFAGSAEVDFETHLATEDVTLTAQWKLNKFTVAFVSNGGSAVQGIENVPYDTAIAKPTDPTKLGYTFAGWYREVALTTLWNFSTDKVKAETTLYAKWTQDKYTVTFNSKGGSAVAAIPNLVYGDTVTKPATPTLTGYTFSGWFTEEAYTTQWKFTGEAGASTLTGGITLYAKWTINTYIVHFNSNGGSAVGDIEDVVYNTSITAPTQPTKTKHLFKGWYRDIALSNAWNFATDVVQSEITLYARWEEILAPTLTLANDTLNLNTNAAKTSDVAYATLSEATLLAYIGATATTTEPGQTVAITTDFAAQKANHGFAPLSSGSYTVTITAKDKYNQTVTKTVAVTVTDNTAPAVTPATVALDYRVGTAGLVDNKLIADANLTLSDDYATPAQLKPTQTIVWDASFTSSTIGVYTGKISIKDTVNNETLVPVSVTIWKERVEATAFTLGTKDVPNMTKTNYIELGKAKAYYDDGSGEVEVVITEVTSAVVKAPGVYLVTYKTVRGTTGTCDVTVFQSKYRATLVFGNGQPNTTYDLYPGAFIPHPGNPVREGHTFLGWVGAGKNWVFGEDPMPEDDLTVYAYWKLGVGPTPPPSSSSRPISPSSTISSSASSSSSGSSTATTSPVESVSSSSSQGNSGGAGVVVPGSGSFSGSVALSGSGGVPLVTPTAPTDNTWALLNVIASLLNAIILVVMLCMLGNRRTVAKLLWLPIATVFALAMILILVFTSNFGGAMVLMNKLTLVFVISAVLQIVVFFLYARRTNHKQFTGNDSASYG